jgi:hypothetical protein
MGGNGHERARTHPHPGPPLEGEGAFVEPTTINRPVH